MSEAMVVQPSGSPRLGGRSKAHSESSASRIAPPKERPMVNTDGKQPRRSVPAIPTIVLSPPVDSDGVMPKLSLDKRNSLPAGKHSSQQVS